MPKFKVNPCVELGKKSDKVKAQTRINQSRSKVKPIHYFKANPKQREKIESRKTSVIWGGLDVSELPKWARRMMKRSMRFSA